MLSQTVSGPTYQAGYMLGLNFGREMDINLVARTELPWSEH